MKVSKSIRNKVLLAAPLTMLSCVVAAGGLDRTGHPYENIFDEGNTVSLDYTHVKPDHRDGIVNGVAPVNNVLGSYSTLVVDAKRKVSDKVDCMLQYDNAPYGLNGDYNNQLPGGVNKTEINSREVSGLCSFAVVSAPDHKVKLLAGVSSKKIDGSFDAANGAVGAVLDGESDHAGNFGVSFEKASTKSRVSLMYFGETNHEMKGTFTHPKAGAFPVTAEVVIPRAIRLDMTTGLSSKYQIAGSAGVMHSKWSDSESLVIPQVPPAGFAEPLFNEDVTVYYVGLGKKVSDKVSVGGKVIWENASNPPGIRGAVDDRQTLALGAKINMGGGLEVSPKIAYTHLEAANGTGTGGTVEFDESDALAAGVAVKLTY